MASLWKHPKSPFWNACFTAHVGASARQLKLTTGTADRKLARRIADELDDVGRGVRTSDQIKAFLEGITDLRAKRAARHACDSVMRRTTGRSLESKSARGFVESWLKRTKTVTPLAGALLQHIQTLPAGDDPKAPLHPRALATIARSKNDTAGALSNQFNAILAEAGLVPVRSHSVKDEKQRKGRDGRRAVSEISFHSLRHTAVSLLKTAGVSDAVAQDLVGHESVEISRHYTHIESPAKRAAVDKLPVLEAGTPKPDAEKK